MQKLLTRTQFRDAVFKRDNHACVICKAPAKDAHHILERRLFADGGYYIDNGASLCAQHHLDAEKTVLSVEAIRIAANITRVVVPEHLYADTLYDKWGNPVLPNGTRMRGELFFDESVQKILNEGGVLPSFTDYVKYPRTHHLSFSESIQSDDRVIASLASYVGKRIIVTLKMDGECTSMYPDYLHARSIDGRSHPSRDWVKNFWSKLCYNIPKGWRICGENLYAEHSIAYTDLLTYFMGFSIWNEFNQCLDWDSTMEWFELLGITPVPVLYDGIFDEAVLRKLAKNLDTTTQEGFTVRLAEGFGYGEFRYKMAKFVRKGHVQTQKHWMYGQPVKPNRLKDRDASLTTNNGS